MRRRTSSYGARSRKAVTSVAFSALFLLLRSILPGDGCAAKDELLNHGTAYEAAGKDLIRRARLIEPIEMLSRKCDLEGAEIVFRLGQCARPHDRRRDRGVRERPGDGYLRRGRADLFGHGA